MSQLASSLRPAVDSVSIQQESWAKLWQDAAPLAALHYDEVDGGVEPRRQLRVDTEQMTLADLSGHLKIWTARQNGELLGYILWTVGYDPESKGLLMAEMGPWFVLEGWAGTGAKLFDQSLVGLKALGVRCCYPHHRLQGRGTRLGHFFAARGATEIKHTYSLWIGDR